jgi:hypothetical protein
MITKQMQFKIKDYFSAACTKKKEKIKVRVRLGLGEG